AGAADDQPVAVIGLGDIEMGRLITPRLSTIRVHGRTIGEAAARLVLDRSGPRRVDVGFELVVRESG
ncbi:MAG TPA: substrate-binding domain-containing protein, partial [Rhodopila sp.]|nr:substrate-binding domain-containing protein [Rhodopila sp.]